MYRNYYHFNTVIQLRKRDADLFGSKDVDLPIPPSCLVTVWADISCDPKTRLRHPVILTGIDSDTRKIYISRFLETLETTNTTGRGTYIYIYIYIYTIVIIIIYAWNALIDSSFRIY